MRVIFATFRCMQILEVFIVCFIYFLNILSYAMFKNKIMSHVGSLICRIPWLEMGIMVILYFILRLEHGHLESCLNLKMSNSFLSDASEEFRESPISFDGLRNLPEGKKVYVYVDAKGKLKKSFSVRNKGVPMEVCLLEQFIEIIVRDEKDFPSGITDWRHCSISSKEKWISFIKVWGCNWQINHNSQIN